jgi:hypothetical protein
MFDSIVASFESNILQLSSTPFWIGSSIVSALSLWAFYRMSSWYRYARMIENVPTAKIRSAAQGYVELSGRTKLMDGPIIISPLTGNTCVWYSYKIEERTNSFRHERKGRSSHWRLVEQKRSEELFILEDDTGQCVIDPDDADVIATNKKTWYKHHVIPPRRYTEQLITEGEMLHAIGLFKTVADVESKKIRQRVAHLLRQWKSDPNQLIHLYDSDRDGDLQPAEWEKARQAAETHVRLEQGNKEKLEQLSVLSSSTHKDQAFILSTVSEQKLIKKYKWRAIRALLLFFVSAGLAVWALNVRLGI